MPLSDDHIEVAPSRSETNPIFWFVIGGILLLGYSAFSFGPAATSFLNRDVALPGEAPAVSTGNDDSDGLGLTTPGSKTLVGEDEKISRVVDTPALSTGPDAAELDALRQEVQRLNKQIAELQETTTSNQQSIAANGEEIASNARLQPVQAVDLSRLAQSSDVSSLSEKLASLRKEFGNDIARVESLARTREPNVDVAAEVDALRTSVATRLRDVEKQARRFNAKSVEFDRFINSGVTSFEACDWTVLGDYGAAR